MGIPVFDTWAARHAKTMPLTCLKDSVIGVDADHYLGGLLAPSREPLLSAHGGFPLSLETIIVKELGDLQSAGFKLHFVFNGLDYGMKDQPFRQSIESAQTNAQAFEVYEKAIPSQAVMMFRNSGALLPSALSEFFKRVLYEHEIEFTVAPFSAQAQLAYYEKHPSRFIDAVYGPSEMFLYGVDKLITKLEPAYQYREAGNTKSGTVFILEKSVFWWLDRRVCLEELGRIPSETFIDALLLAGSRNLPSFPPLENPALFSKGISFQDVVTMLVSSGRNVTNLCAQYQEDPTMKSSDYADRYKRASTAIRHHVVITADGGVQILDEDHAPSDVHDCVGQRLPEEITMYLSRGMIRPRILNWLTSGIILINSPFEGGDSIHYQTLVKSQLEPIRQQALCLLSDCLNRYYRSKEITTRFWFDQASDIKINLKDIPSVSKESLGAWKVAGSTIIEQRRKLESVSDSPVPGSLAFAIRSLGDTAFASKTKSPKSKSEPAALSTRHEIAANALWRFLQLRQYVNDSHQLTGWGKSLEAALLYAGPSKEQQEACFFAMELLRLGLLNANHSSGATTRGTEIDKRNCLLVSRVACLGKLRHEPKGYSGPLDRHMLAYYSTVNALQTTLRDLAETCLTTMFLDGDVNRDRNDWMDLALSIPFFEENSCGLGIVVKTYLEQLVMLEDPTNESVRSKLKAKGQGEDGWCPHCDFIGSLDDAFHLWDAVYKGVKTANGEVKEQELWDNANQWLSARR